MKLFLMSSDAIGRHCGIMKSQLLDYLPLTDNLQEADAVVVSVSYLVDYVFNKELWAIKKPVILIDYLEFGWNFDFKSTNILGDIKNNSIFVRSGMYAAIQWELLHEWVEAYKPSTYFKRELLESDRTERLLPCEYLCYLPKTPIQNEEEFNARPIEVFFNFGWSHPQRINLHSDIISAMNTHNIGTVTNWTQLPQYFEHKSLRTWLSIYSPWYDRQSMKNVLEWQSKSKLSISLAGAGQKTFRDSEMLDVIPVFSKNKLAYSHPWIEGKNCLKLDFDLLKNPIEQLNDFTKQGNLYSIYVNSQKNLDNYRPRTFVDNYILPNISKNL